jgi:hypothetical protein
VSGNGIFSILKRDHARQLAALQGDDAVRKLATEVQQSKAYRNEGLILDCGTAWDAIHRCLTEGTLDPNAGDFPLNHCVLGGRRLHQGPGFEAVLIRPDIVPHVAEAIRDVKRADFHERYFQIDPTDYGRTPTDKEFDIIWNAFRQIQQLMDDATAERAAVLFTVEHQSPTPRLINP